MKAEQMRTQLLGAILAFLASFGGVGMLVTAFQFTEISLFPIALVCAGAAVLFSLCAGFRGFPAVPAALALIGIVLWYQGVLNTSTEALLYQISRLYSLGYGWDVVNWNDQLPDPQDAALALSVLGILIALAVVWSFVRSRDSWVAILVAFLPLLPCIVLTDTVPSGFYLYLQLLSILLLLLPQVVRRLSVAQSNRLTVLIALPVALALGVLFLLVPRDGYTGVSAAEKLDHFLETLLQVELPEAEPRPPVVEDDVDEKINLSAIGPKETWDIPVMDVICDQTEILYLRGSCYDVYTGTSWVMETGETLFPLYSGPVYGSANVTVSTRLPQDVLYLPFRPQRLDSGSTIITNFNSTTVNSKNLREYTVIYSTMNLIQAGAAQNPVPRLYADSAALGADVVPDYLTFGGFPARGEILDHQGNPVSGMPSAYLELDEDTLARAQAALGYILPESYISQRDIAYLIAEYVSTSAVYDLQTEKMPADETDFAMWFLENSDTGYCVHFASAATVLLRAAGIPARYVTGYLADAQANVSVQILQKSAHAWAECFIPGMGWVIVEATPADGIHQTVSNEIPDPTETTENEETTDTTELTEPPQTDTPTEPSEPTLPGDTSINPPPGVEFPTGPADESYTIPASLRSAIAVSLWIVCLFVALILQWRLRVHLRRVRRRRGGHNARALACWQEVTLYCRLQKITPEPALHTLALKARFSQYTLTREEVGQFYGWLRTAEERTRRADQKQRLLATLFYALY